MKGFDIAMIAVITSAVFALTSAVNHYKPVKFDAATGAIVLRYGSIFRAIGYISLFAGPVLLGLVSIAKPPNKTEDYLAILGILGIFGGLGAPLVWETTRFSISVSDQGLDCRSAWKKQRYLTWAEIDSISYSVINSWFIIRACDGWKIHVNLFVPGLNQFLQHCERNLKVFQLQQARMGYQSLGRPFPSGK